MTGQLPWSLATWEKYEKLTLLDTLKIHFQRFFAFISNGLNEVINSLMQIAAFL